MFVRALLLCLAFSAPAFGQGTLFKRPPKPKVIATPTPAPAPVAPKPPRKRPPAKPAEPAPAPTGTAYFSKVKAAFAARWAEVVTPESGAFTPGNVSVLFTLDPEGKVTACKVTENTSNAAFGKFCEKFVSETTFEKPPEKSLVDGSLEIPFTFWIY